MNRKEYKKLYAKKYYEKNRDKIIKTTKERLKEDYKNNKEKYRLKNINYYNENKELCLKRSKQYYIENKEHCLNVSRNYHKNHKHFNFIDYCPEHYKEIKNYDLAKLDNFEGWICHHINGEQFDKKWLKKNNMYYNRKDPHEFIFLPKNKRKAKELMIETHADRHKHTLFGR